MAYVGIWFLIAVFFSVLMYFSNVQARPERPIKWENIFLWQAIIYGWAILFPFISRMAKRFRVGRDNWRRMLPLHLSAAFLFVLAHVFLYVVSYHLFHGFYSAGDRRFLETVAVNFLSNWLLDASMYFVILSAVTARDYSQRFQAEQLKSSQLHAALVDSQLSALKMQLQPHFLFNTLNSISTLMHEDVKAADEMVARLGDFLRLTLESSGEQIVTLAQELNFINGYLAIEIVRFGERLTVEREVETETLRARVPNLILQPLIENCIKHGISRQIRAGKISIRAARCDETLRLQVEDNGPGLRNENSGNGGIGLANTRARLFNLYGGNQRIEVVNLAAQGLIVTLEIPFETDSKITGQ